ncbi:MAG TPA: hypothetical protein VFR30_03960 [Lysobacter sp.]|nr:hypothetical protein [Lysobacter sp.]
MRVRLARSRGWVAFLSLTAGLATANLVAWALLRGDAAGVAAVALPLGAAVAFAVGAWAWRRQAPGDLSWDGARWQWGGHEGDVQVAIDLSRWMLLCFDASAGRRCWIAASRGATTGPWAALRAALYSRRPADRPDAPPA